jgi:hypothetical protein
VIGTPGAAAAQKGEKLLQAAGNAVAPLIANREFWDLPA